jgi:hypothetical protein
MCGRARREGILFSVVTLGLAWLPGIVITLVGVFVSLPFRIKSCCISRFLIAIHRGRTTVESQAQQRRRILSIQYLSIHYYPGGKVLIGANNKGATKAG